jgi:UDP-glucose 4-epimerase
MRVAVTGASGFIGSVLVPELRARGHEARAVMRDAMTSGTSFAGMDVLVHLANLAHGRAAASRLQQVNVEGTRKLASLAAATGVRRVIYLSSVKAVGEGSGDRPLDGSERPAPQDDYGRSKLAAEHALQEVAAASGLEVVVLRPPLVYGPGVKANFLALMRIIDRGWPLPLAAVSSRRSLAYVGNLCDAIATCLGDARAAGRTYFVTDGPAPSVAQLCRAIGGALDRPARLFAFPTALIPVARFRRSLEVDDAALRRELDWRPPFSLEEGLRATAAWYRRR